MQNRYADFFPVYTNSIAARGFLLCYGSAVTFHDLYVGKRSGPFHGTADSYITCKTVTRIFSPCTIIQLQLADFLDFFFVTDQLLPSTTSTSARGAAHFMARLTCILHAKPLRGFFFPCTLIQFQVRGFSSLLRISCYLPQPLRRQGKRPISWPG
jgi:hypothetical protein